MVDYLSGGLVAIIFLSACLWALVVMWTRLALAQSYIRDLEAKLASTAVSTE